MGFIVVYDACVLYPASLLNLLVRLASKRVVEARWSSEILTEFVEALKKRQPHLESQELRTGCIFRSGCSEASPAENPRGFSFGWRGENSVSLPTLFLEATPYLGRNKLTNQPLCASAVKVGRVGSASSDG